MIADLVFQSASDIAAAIREGRASAVAVLQQQLTQLHRHNPALNAVVTHDQPAALRRAAEADAALARGEVWGPLHGVSLTVKDVFETAGMRTTASFRPLAKHVPREDATVVARLRAAGAIVWGKTNMPAMAMDFQTQSPIFGRAANPYDVGRTPGGSSGGSAAAVAAGISAFEVGSDIGGSIRIPAHFCGLFGLKPTENRIPLTGHVPGLPGEPRGVRHMGSAGPLARSAADLRLVFSVLAGPEPGDCEVPAVPVEAARPRAIDGLRLAWTDDFGGVRPSAEVREALASFVSTLSARGAQVARARPGGLDFPTAWSTWGELLGAEIGAPLAPPIRLLFQAQFLSMAGRDPLASAIARGARTGMRGYFETLTRRDVIIASLERFLGGWDAWICPVATVPAIEHTKPGKKIRVDGAEVTYMTALAAFTAPFNVTGSPVVAMPVGRTRAGLPIGVQIVGRRWAESALLDVVEAIAGVTPGFVRPSGY